MATISDLADQTETEFGFLSELGYLRTGRDLFAESYYRGGFTLTYTSTTSSCVVVYSDMQLEVTLDEQRIFDHITHPGFSGNMFSREHLSEHLPRIAAQIRAVVSGDAQRVA